MNSQRPNPDYYFKMFLMVCVALLIYSRLHFMHIPLERDEGEYAYSGQLMLHGYHPYKEAYNMKFPGTYFAYAMFMFVGGENIAAIRHGTFFILLLTALFVFLIVKNWFNTTSALLAAVVYLALNSTMGGEGIMSNAEHFVIFFAAFGTYILFAGLQKNRLLLMFLSGLLLGCAVIMKQHGYVFVVFGIMITVFQLLKRPGPTELKKTVAFCVITVIPMAMLITYIISNGLWGRFKFLTIDYAREYLKMCSPDVTRYMWHASLTNIGTAAWPLWQLSIVMLSGLLLPIKIPHRFKLLLLLALSYLALSMGGIFQDTLLHTNLFLHGICLRSCAVFRCENQLLCENRDIWNDNDCSCSLFCNQRARPLSFISIKSL